MSSGLSAEMRRGTVTRGQMAVFLARAFNVPM